MRSGHGKPYGGPTTGASFSRALRKPSCPKGRGWKGAAMKSGKAIRYRLLVGIGFWTALVLGGCRPMGIPEDTAAMPPVFHVRQLGLVANPALVEASGMAHSRREADLLWVVNDSGHPAVLFAVQSNGHDQGRVVVAGAVNSDWEDLAGFEWEGAPYILIADVGDNEAVRDTRRIYVVPEPVRRAAGVFPARIDVAWQFDFRYEDGPRDCEGVGVDTHDERIVLITKRTDPPQIYTLPLRPPMGAVVKARKIGTVPGIPSPTARDLVANPYLGASLSQPTALDIRSDNRLVVVLTYKDAYLFPRAAGEDWISALGRKPLTVPLPKLKQKESGCLTPDGRRLYVSTEQRPAPLLAVDLASIP